MQCQQSQQTIALPAPPSMNPQQLFTNPGYSPASTPVLSRSQQSTTPHTLTPMSTENSPASTESSSLTPSLSGMQLGKHMGHPRKIPKQVQQHTTRNSQCTPTDQNTSTDMQRNKKSAVKNITHAGGVSGDNNLCVAISQEPG